MILLNLSHPRIQSLFIRMDHLEESIGNLITANSSKKWLTEKDLMKMLDVGRSKLRQFRNEGLLSYNKTGRKYLYSESSVNELLKNMLKVDFGAN